MRIVSARLLADIDCKLRAFTHAIRHFKQHTRGAHRPFGGFNVLIRGDVWQLPPLDGGLFGDIPV